MCVIFALIILLVNASSIFGVKLDFVDCGIDNSPKVHVGTVEVSEYPWLGVLYYINYGEIGEMRAVTSVILIQKEFVLGPAADIGPMPKNNFRKNSRVLLGAGWTARGRRVRSYVLHPEYRDTHNTVALVQLKMPVTLTPTINIRPLCPPPDILRDPEFYVMRFQDDYNELRKEVIPVMHVPGDLCKDFYVSANLYAKMMRPPHVACVVSVLDRSTCVWEAGAALAARDHWGRWMLLGLGVRGPGCGAPSRFLDMMSYYPWVEDSLALFSRLTISKINTQKYVLRSSQGASRALQRFGDCDMEEKHRLVYRERILLKTSNNQYQFLTYNMTIQDEIEYTCLTLELVNASAVSEMRVTHYCPRSYGISEFRSNVATDIKACHNYDSSVFDISVHMMFSDGCLFEMIAWGEYKRMKLLNIQDWKLEEGTYYADFSLTRTEYKGTQVETGFGFEPLDESLWIPDYDMWNTTPPSTSTTDDSQFIFASGDQNRTQTYPEDDFQFGVVDHPLEPGPYRPII